MFSNLYNDLIDETIESVYEWLLNNIQDNEGLFEILEELVIKVLERRDEVIGN